MQIAVSASAALLLRLESRKIDARELSEKYLTNLLFELSYKLNLKMKKLFAGEFTLLSLTFTSLIQID